MELAQVVQLLHRKSCNSFRSTGGCIHPACYEHAQAAHAVQAAISSIRMMELRNHPLVPNESAPIAS